jgi:tetratricopeptide (TPR) repeat protein
MQRNLMAMALLVLGAATLGTVAAADEPEARQLYGSGVHAYFAGNYTEAHEFLNGAIDLKSSDPRVYYFRGLALWQLGRQEKAREDFAKGADFEVRAVDDPAASVNRALERVQGKARLEIEKLRLTARKEKREKQISDDDARYNRIRSNEPKILEGFPPKQPPKTSDDEPEPKAIEKKEPPADDGSESPPPKTAKGRFDPFKEASLPRLAKKPVIEDPEPEAPKLADVKKTIEPVPVAPKPVDPAPAVAASGAPKKSGALALLRALGRVAENNVPDLSELPSAIGPGAKLPPKE